MLKFSKTSSDRLRFISSTDEAVSMDGTDAVERYQRYLDDLDPSHLELCGEPTVFVLRPLTQEVIGIAAQLSRGLVMPGQYMDPQAVRELVRLSCEAIEPEPDGMGEADLYRFEYRRKVLSPDLMAQVPDGALREAAQVLINSLPDFQSKGDGTEDDPFGPSDSEG